ncbi:magnesium and cobalt transport protein [Candidatus Moduliflexus flocculans]|uniref:Magnesium and cobalt transport protein n=1 Tax=Candidatus Moduliflexus flocculans TaxID=1499966 RepID=A0A0S6VRG4_9BACT|nr:magnesium and cobalt transport protein [Candidatus Moduliflexus flocculans]
MIRIFDGSNQLIEVENPKAKGSWIHLTSPTDEELQHIYRIFQGMVPMDFLTDPLDINERSRIEVDDHSVLIIARFPVFNQSRDIAFTTQPVGIIYTEDAILTICCQDSDIFADFINGKVKNFSTQFRSRFMLQLFLKIALRYLSYLKEINLRTAEIEKELHQAMKNEELIKLLNLEKSLVFFTTSLKSNEIVMERLQKIPMIKMYPDDQDLLEEVMIENKQAIEMANIYSNILSGMMDAFASIISNNLNVVMKFLTSVTIILALPTLVASIYGMNVALPFQDLPHAFAITMFISFAVAGYTVYLFFRQKFF